MQDEKISFSNTKKAFAARSDREIGRALWLFRMMRRPWLVKLSAFFIRLAVRIGIPVSGLLRKTIFKQFCGGENLGQSMLVVSELERSKIGAILDYSVEAGEKEEDFANTTVELKRVIRIASKNPAVPYASVKLTGLVRPALLELYSAGKKADESEQHEYSLFLERLKSICIFASTHKVPVYIDAEESWIQTEIDRIAEMLMLRYNKESAIVNTTVQMYRHDRLEYLRKLIDSAYQSEIFIGVKLVRGAYIEKENLRAAREKYPSPIQPDKAATDRDFDAAVDLCLAHIDRVTLCAGTHNENSTLHLLHRMEELGIAKDHPHVYFSQLYGMSDHISYNLAAEGYNVTKYLPYGPVKSVIPYLIRRAQENTSIAGQAGRELQLLSEEHQRRSQEKLLQS